MQNNEENTKLTLESYGNIFRWESNHSDTDIEEILYAFYGLLTAASWQPESILRGMLEFADERLDFFNNNKENNE